MSLNFTTLSPASKLKLADLLFAKEQTECVKQKGDTSDILVLLRAGNRKLPLYLFHPITGDVSSYVAMASHLNIEHKVMGIRSPLLDNTNADVQTLDQMAELYIKAMDLEDKSIPIVLGGWSMGGMLAFEVCCRLLDRGYSIKKLLLFDAALPVQPSFIELVNDSGLIQLLVDMLPQAYRPPLLTLIEESDVQRIGDLKSISHTGRHLFTSRQANIIYGIVHMLEINYRAIKQYHTQRCIANVPTLIIYARVRKESDVRKAWSPFIAEHMARYVAVTGDHFTILQNQSSVTCANLVTEFLNA